MKDKKLLGLLDDSVVGVMPSENEWLQITEAPIKTAKAQAKAAAAPTQQKPLTTSQKLRQGALPSKGLTTTPKGTRIFRNRPSLKQLMSEYNGRNSSLLPLKSASTATKPRFNAKPTDFQYDSVEVMEVPSVPGKILRPSTED